MVGEGEVGQLQCPFADILTLSLPFDLFSLYLIIIIKKASSKKVH